MIGAFKDKPPAHECVKCGRKRHASQLHSGLCIWCHHKRLDEIDAAEKRQRDTGQATLF